MLSSTSRYAVRALVELARAPAGERVFGHDLATRAGLPATYLSKILASLGRAGIVEGSRGTAGGYRLCREPGELTLLEVVEVLDGPRPELECLLRPGHDCSTEDPCSAHREWAELRESYEGFLTGTSIGALAGTALESGPAATGSGTKRKARQEEDRD